MEQIRKGDPLPINDATEPMVASRDEYRNRVWVMTAREYRLHSEPNSPRGEEQPYLILPDRTLVRDFQHGLPDYKG
jgi:hypothetical protein